MLTTPRGTKSPYSTIKKDQVIIMICINILEDFVVGSEYSLKYLNDRGLDFITDQTSSDILTLLE